VSDIVAFLRARLNEDDARARGQGPVVVQIHGAQPLPTPGGYSPARVLREVEAKRLRIEHYLKVCEMADPARRPDQAYVLAKGAVEKALMLDALPHADHPDYDEAWRP
jgi:hypothetical protein